MNQAQWTELEKVIDQGDADAVESWANCLEDSDHPALIEKYQQATNWQQKDAISLLLARHFTPSLEPIFLDYMQVPITKELQMFTLAQIMRHFGEDYDQVNRYFTNYDVLIKALGEILAKFGLQRPPEPAEKTTEEPAEEPAEAEATDPQGKAKPKKKTTPLTAIPLTADLAETITPEQQILVALEREALTLLARAIAKGADLDARIEHKPLTGCTPLMAAINLKQADAALRLIEAGADVTLRRSDRRSDKGVLNPEQGQTAIYWAMSQSNMAVVEALLAAGAPVDCPDHYGTTTPLSRAVDYGNIAFAERLLEAGADLNHPCYREKPLLHRAVKYDELEMAKYLLRLGVDIEARPLYGATALYSAVVEGSMDHVRLLLSHGANPNISYTVDPTRPPLSPSYQAGMTPLAFATKRQEEFSKLLGTP